MTCLPHSDRIGSLLRLPNIMIQVRSSAPALAAWPFCAQATRRLDFRSPFSICLGHLSFTSLAVKSPNFNEMGSLFDIDYDPYGMDDSFYCFTSSPVTSPNANNPDKPFDPAPFFNSASFSDILIQFSGREIKAHRIFLCSRSAYFEKALSPDAQFKEQMQQINGVRRWN